MNSRVTEVYSYYKELYPQIVSLFRVDNSYEAYFEDAVNIAPVIGLPVQGKAMDNGFVINVVAVPAGDILDYVAVLSMNGIDTKLIVQRNSAGKFALPDIKELEKDKNLDY